MSWRVIVAVLAVTVAPAVGAARIVIDVGHYHKKPGAISARGVAEFNYNLRLAKDIEAALKREGHSTMLIGDDGRSENLGSRAPHANGMDLFISIHHDSVQSRFIEPWIFEGEARGYSDRFSGYSLFVSHLNPKLPASLKCASAIGAALRGEGFTPSLYHADPTLGENRPFADKTNGVHYFDNLAVLKTARVPALLFEAGVIVNRDEELVMRDPAARAKIAAAVVSGIGSCLERLQVKRGEK